MTKGGRGLLMVWRWELVKILQVNWYLSRQSRGATLEIMAQMDLHPGWRPGIAWETFCDCMTMEISSPPWLGINRLVPGWRISHKDCQLHGPGVWVGVPQLIVFWPSLPTPSSTSSDSLEPSTLQVPDWTRVRVWGFGLLCPVFWLFWHRLSDGFNQTDCDPDFFSFLSFLLLYCILSLGKDVNDYYLSHSFLPLFYMAEYSGMVVCSMWCLQCTLIIQKFKKPFITWKYFGLTVKAVRSEQWVKKGMEVGDDHILI